MATSILLPAADRVARPWKDGGGITREIAVFPVGAGIDDFQWRVSTAVVENEGPFSSFAEIDRTLVVLSGSLNLQIESDAARLLTASDPPLFFPGDAKCYGTPIDGPVHDLNVMVRRSIFTADVRRGVNEQVSVEGAICLVVAIGKSVVTVADKQHDLRPLDALLIEEDGTVISVAGGGVFIIMLYKRESC